MKAFPTLADNAYKPHHNGMALRDYFAAKAIPALITGGMHTNVWELSRDAYKIADAMMEVREEDK